MYFDTLEIINFGPFSKFKTSFSPTGLNLISGPNAAGKTQLGGAIIFSILGNRVIDRYQDGRYPSEVTLSICEGGISEVIKSKLSGIKSKIQVTHTFQPQVGSKSTGFSEYLKDLLLNQGKPNLILSDYSWEDTLFSPEHISALTDFQWEGAKIEPEWLNFYNNLESVEFQSKYLSESQRLLAIVFQEFVFRQKIDYSVPLIVDCFSPLLNWGGLDLIGNLLERISKRDQVIILSIPNAIPKSIMANAKNHLELKSVQQSNYSLISYNYFPRQKLRKTNRKKQLVRKFLLGQKIYTDENRYYEFKEIKGNNPTRSIGALVDQYAVAFLNMGSIGVGRIYWGVRDDGYVCGVRLDQKGRDEVRRLITEKLHKIQPVVAPSKYKITIHPIFDVENDNADLYLIEVQIPSSPSGFLYSTGKGEVYIKTDAGKKKLSPLEIQKEILSRHEIKMPHNPA